MWLLDRAPENRIDKKRIKPRPSRLFQNIDLFIDGESIRESSQGFVSSLSQREIWGFCRADGRNNLHGRYDMIGNMNFVQGY